MKSQSILELVQDQLVGQATVEKERVGKLNQLVRRQGTPRDQLGRKVREQDEKNRLRSLSRNGLLGLVVDYCSQQMVAQGVFSDRGETVEAGMWEPWELSGMPTKQGALYTSALMYGYSNILVLPENLDSPLNPGRAVIRPYSPETLYAVWGDPIEDEHPLYMLRTIPQASGYPLYRFIDEESVTFIGNEEGCLVELERRDHGMGVCPGVRFAVNTDLNGSALSEPDKHRIDAARSEKTTNDRLLAQHYNSWKIKTATGMSEDISDADMEQFKLKLRQDSILIGEGETKFGVLEETSLDPLVKAEEYDRDMLAAVSQTPVWAFNGGQLVNLAAEALIEAKSGNRQKVLGFQRGFGRSIASTIRLASLAENRFDDAEDYSLSVTWRDIDEPTLAQAFDAWGKGATQLGIPVRAIWEKLPGVSPREAARWAEFAARYPSEMEALAAAISRQGESYGEQSAG